MPRPSRRRGAAPISTPSPRSVASGESASPKEGLGLTMQTHQASANEGLAALLGGSFGEGGDELLLED